MSAEENRTVCCYRQCAVIHTTVSTMQKPYCIVMFVFPHFQGCVEVNCGKIWYFFLEESTLNIWDCVESS